MKRFIVVQLAKRRDRKNKKDTKILSIKEFVAFSEEYKTGMKICVN